jgi:hypothetical protein
MNVRLHNFIHTGQFSIVERLVIVAIVAYIVHNVYLYLT